MQLEVEDKVEELRSQVNLLLSMIEQFKYEISSFEVIDEQLKRVEASIKQSRKIVRIELEGREANRRRQEQKTKEKNIWLRNQ